MNRSDSAAPGRLGLGAAVAIAAALSAGSQAAPGAAPSLRELVGQRLVVPMTGTTPGRALLGRIERGEVGGVILFGANVRSREQVRALTTSLHAAARRGRRPRLLVYADQEGGAIRRFRWLPPGLPASTLGGRSIAFVEAAGVATGAALRGLGVDVDLAPVADVPRTPRSFIEAQQRAFSTDPAVAGSRAAAFARGLEASGVLATAKHFPGLGGAEQNTDLAAVSIRGDAAALAADLVPFRRLVDGGIPVVMLSNAAYPAYGGMPAAWSPAVQELLRGQLGFTGVTVTDALEALARARHVSASTAALRAAQAGADLILLAGDERTSARVFDGLLEAAADGRLPRAGLEASYARVLALKPRG